MRALRFLSGLVVFLAARTLQAAATDVTVDAHGDATVDVISELTDAGKKTERPTPGHPAYYVPVSAGYHPGGQLNFWKRQPPTETEIFKVLSKELAGQGYLLATHEHRPSLILVISWGYIAPHPFSPSAYRMYIGDRASRPTAIPLHAIANWGEMMDLTGGTRSLYNTWAETDRGAALNEAVVAAGVPRYYIVVVAADFPDWLRHQYTALWTTRLSVPYWGCYLDEALPALLKTGAPLFGRDMLAPQMVKTSMVPEGRVDVGAPVLKNFEEPGTRSPATP